MEKNDLEEALNEIEETALWIAYERMIETQRDDALFKDPYSAQLSGSTGRGKGRSDKMTGMSAVMGLGDWKEFHIQWTAVRTRYIDEWLATELTSLKKDHEKVQVVNLGAGVCTRPFRLPVLQDESIHLFEIDTASLNVVKNKIVAALDVKVKCKRKVVDCNLAEAGSLKKVLSESGFDSSVPTVWILEGLLMYLKLEEQYQLVKEISSLSSSKSAANINFLESLDPKYCDMTTRTDKLKESLEGWDLFVCRFGEDALNFGRYPDKLEPTPTFSLAVCKKP